MAYDTTVFRSPSYWIALASGVIGIAGAAMQERRASGSAARSSAISFDDIQRGDRVTILSPHGQEHTGKAVMRSSHGGWVLNMGGQYGTPGLADEDNVVRVRRSAAKAGSRAFDPDADERHQWQRKESKRGARLPPTPCPSCVRRGERRPNMLTPYEKARGYQCADCTARDEGGGY